MTTAPSILLVEDDDVIAADVQDVLDGFGYEVVGRADNAADAVEMAKDEAPDLVLMDINLVGEADGISAADEIRKDSKIPVVFLTALADKQTLERAMVTDPYGYVLKPLREAELRAALEIALYRSRTGPTGGSAPVTPVSSELDGPAPTLNEDERVIAQELRRIEPFNVLTDSRLDIIAQKCRRQDFKAHEAIVFEGDLPDSGLVVLEGCIASVKASASGKELIVDTLPPGDPFGLFPTLDKQPYSVTLRALVPTSVLWIPREAVMAVLDLYPEVSRKLLQEVFDRLREAQDFSRQLAHDLVEVRVASALLSMIPKFCLETVEDGKPVMIISLTRQSLADMIGSTSETVIRITKSMERDGILDLSKTKSIRVLDIDQLRKMATLP